MFASKYNKFGFFLKMWCKIEMLIEGIEEQLTYSVQKGTLTILE